MSTNNNEEKIPVFEFAQRKFKKSEYDKLLMQGKNKPSDNNDNSNNEKD